MELEARFYPWRIQGVLKAQWTVQVREVNYYEEPMRDNVPCGGYSVEKNI